MKRKRYLSFEIWIFSTAIIVFFIIFKTDKVMKIRKQLGNLYNA